MAWTIYLDALHLHRMIHWLNPHQVVKAGTSFLLSYPLPYRLSDQLCAWLIIKSGEPYSVQYFTRRPTVPCRRRCLDSVLNTQRPQQFTDALSQRKNCRRVYALCFPCPDTAIRIHETLEQCPALILGCPQVFRTDNLITECWYKHSLQFHIRIISLPPHVCG